MRNKFLIIIKFIGGIFYRNYLFANHIVITWRRKTYDFFETADSRMMDKDSLFARQEKLIHIAVCREFIKRDCSNIENTIH